LPELTVRAERRNLGHNAFDWDGAGEDLGPSAVPPRPTLQVISDKPPLTLWHLWHCCGTATPATSAMRKIGHKESPALAGLSVRRNVEPENRICGYMIDREQVSSAVALTV
jgi:hypothetical protein